MTDAARVDVPSGQVSGQKNEKCILPKISILGQPNGAEPSEQIRRIGSENGSDDSLLKPTMLENADELPERKLPGSENQAIHCCDVIRSCQTEKSSCHQQCSSASVKNFGGVQDQDGSWVAQNVSAAEYSDPPLEDVSNGHMDERLEQPSEDVDKSSCLEQFEAPSNRLVKKSGQLGRDKWASKLMKKKYVLRSSVGSERVLRSKVQEMPKPVEASNTMDNVANGAVKGKRGRKKMREERAVPDEYSRIRKRLRYFLHRIHYEQNLIDAYSSEGWKGSSLEKLKPEKELQRATSEILRRKLKIRDLFQHIDSLCAEGRFPKSLFDSEGQIDSEDIFCAKCGSKDLPANNDIILCDGACDRGFHQFCLEPPLLSEDIPPGDEGWLCPGCDCKVDCFDLLNDSHGTELSVSDSWEKVFLEEAAAAARDGKDQDHNLDGPSDDSDDDDYDPDGPGTVEKAEGDESSSDESDYSSDSDELEARTRDDQNLGISSDDSEDDDFDPKAPEVDENEKPKETAHRLSSDDSEDDDYDPDAQDIDDNVKQESSSSDFTSDSEDLELDVPSSGNKKLKRDGTKPSLKDELLGILNPDPSQDGLPPVSAKRHVERLDYKKLHDETYGNLPSDSSDDEDFGSTAPRKRKKSIGDASLVSPNGIASDIRRKTRTVAINGDQIDNEHTPRKTTRQKSLDVSPSSGSTEGNTNPSSYRRLGEAVTQRLFICFKENQYPDRATKESLAQELGLQAKQVSKWFENMRWSWRHPSGKADTVENAPKESGILPEAIKKPVETVQGTTIENPSCNGTENVELLKTSDGVPEKQVLTEESSGQKSATPTLRRKRGRPRVETQEAPAVVDTPEIGVRTRGRQRKSAS